MAKKRIYELLNKVALTVSDLFMIDKSGDANATYVTGQQIVDMVHSELPATENIYTADGVLIGTRTIDGNGFDLTLQNVGVFSVDGVTALDRLRVNGGSGNNHISVFEEGGSVDSCLDVLINSGNAKGVNIENSGTNHALRIDNSGPNECIFVTSQNTGIRVDSVSGHCFWAIGNANNFAHYIQGSLGVYIEGDNTAVGMALRIESGVQVGLIVRGDMEIALPKIQASTSYVDDANAAAGGVEVGFMYRTGNVLKIRMV